MKKGVFLLILSFVLGMIWLIYTYVNHGNFHFVYVTKEFRILSQSITLPDLRLPAFFIIGVLALFVNLCAMIAAMPSVAMGAAVLYAVAIGFEPDCYPYAGLLFLLCLFAAIRMRNTERTEMPGDLSDRLASSRKTSDDRSTAYVHHYTDSAAAAKAAQGSRAYQSKNNAAAREMEAQKKAAAKAMRVSGSSAASAAQVSSYETLRAQEQRDSSRTSSAAKNAFSVLFALLICAAALALVFWAATRKNHSSRNTTRETAFTTTGNDVFDQYLMDKGYLNGADDKSGSGGSETGKADTSKPVDLTGLWVKDPEHPSRSGMAASISDEEISVYWINSDGSTAKYWTGSYKPMEEYKDPYTWVSVRGMTMKPNDSFASTETTMPFTYSDSSGSLRFNAAVMGIPVTYILYRSEENG